MPGMTITINYLKIQEVYLIKIDLYTVIVGKSAFVSLEADEGRLADYHSSMHPFRLINDYCALNYIPFLAPDVCTAKLYMYCSLY